MQNVAAFLHEVYVVGVGVMELTVGDGINEPVRELFVGAQQVWLHKLHHVVVLKPLKIKIIVNK